MQWLHGVWEHDQTRQREQTHIAIEIIWKFSHIRKRIHGTFP